jgi:hypothetical protein
MILAFLKPDIRLFEKIVRSFAAKLATQVRQSFGTKKGSKFSLSICHKRVDLRHSSCAPARRLLTEEGAVAADLGACEQTAH